MTRIVVDASVAAKWFLPESDSEKACRLITDGSDLLAPDVLWTELASAMSKRVRAGDILAEQAIEAIADARALAIRIHGTGSLVERALAVALAHRCSVFDAMYLVLAIDTGSRLLTADAEFIRKLSPGALARHAMCLADYR